MKHLQEERNAIPDALQKQRSPPGSAMSGKRWRNFNVSNESLQANRRDQVYFERSCGIWIFCKSFQIPKWNSDS